MTVINKVFTFLKGNPAIVSGLAAALILPLGFAWAELPSNSTPYPAHLYAQCYDGIDNDGDGFSDLNDPDCPRCYNDIDDDADKLVDFDDPDCPNAGEGKKKVSLGSVLGALFDSEPNDIGGGSIPTGNDIGGGTIASGGSIYQCSRISVFRRVVQNVPAGTGWHYEYEAYCINELTSGRELGRDGVDDNWGGFIRLGSPIGDSGTIFTGGSITIDSGTISTGGDIATGNNIGDGTITTGGSITTGDSIATNGSIGNNGSISGGGNLNTGGTINGSGSATSGGIVQSGGVIPAGGSIN